MKRCRVCGRGIFPFQPAFHAQGIPVLHRSCVGTDRHREGGGGAVAAGPPVPRSHREDPGAGQRRYWAAVNEHDEPEVYWFASLRERAQWVRETPGAAPMTWGEARATLRDIGLWAELGEGNQ